MDIALQNLINEGEQNGVLSLSDQFIFKFLVKWVDIKITVLSDASK